MPTTTLSSHSDGDGWHYTQNDVDNLREQIEQNEAAKRRWLLLGLIVAVGALAGALVLLSTTYALYSSGSGEKEQMTRENTALKAQLDGCRNDLAVYQEKEKKQTEAIAKARESVTQMLPGALGGANISQFARQVYDSPDSRVEMDQVPPSSLFRNWRVQNESGGTDVYTLVGGFVRGKWVIYSNLISRP